MKTEKWMFYVERGCFVPRGKQGVSHLCDVAQRSAVLRKLAVVSWRAGRTGDVYLMREYNTRMCMMDGQLLAQYVMKHGRKVTE